MKTSQFKNLIKEAVKEALMEVLLQPPSITEGKKQPDTLKIPQPIQDTPSSFNPLSAMINETKSKMTSEEYRNILNISSNFTSYMIPDTVQPSSQVGIDISNLGFVKKAKQVLEVAEQKDKQRYGL
jgi:hypothetical protein